MTTDPPRAADVLSFLKDSSCRQIESLIFEEDVGADFVAQCMSAILGEHSRCSHYGLKLWANGTGLGDSGAVAIAETLL